MDEPSPGKMDLIPSRLDMAREAVDRALQLIPQDHYPEARACLEDAQHVINGILRKFPPRVKAHE